MSEFILELFSEELPARMQTKAQNDLLELLKKECVAEGITFGEAFAVSTPRRLTAVFRDLPDILPETTVEKQGPKTSAPQNVIDAFMKANNFTAGQLQKKETPKGEIYVVSQIVPAKAMDDLLPGMIDRTMRAMSWPKSMRWSNTTFKWPRPLLRIMAVFNGRTVAGSLDLGNGNTIVYGNVTSGHRFLNPVEFTVTNFAQYESELYKRHVIVSRDKRREIILDGAVKLAEANGLILEKDMQLLEEVVGLVEWPVILKGEFGSEFLDLPSQVISTSMKVNQKYFATFKDAENLSSTFIFASNMITTDNGVITIRGNEKVIRARLSDAKFFWDQDIKTKLESRIENLKKVKFHDKLGTVYDKSQRLVALSAALAKDIAPNEIDEAKRAATLAKADLTTSLVFEFPELQGLIGYHCAKRQGEKDIVAQAIRSHYAPAGPNDDCPRGAVAAIVALADKLDNLTGFFAIDEVPTSSKDPFALRRAALGCIRILTENAIDFDLFKGIQYAADAYQKPYPEKINKFILERFKNALLDQGYTGDIIDSVLNSADNGNILILTRKIEQLQKFLDSAEGSEILGIANRVNKIIAASKTQNAGSVDSNLLKLDEETALHKETEALKTQQAKSGYVEKMQNLLKINPVLSSFFDNVMVNDEDEKLRNNRLGLLLNVQSLFNEIADFSVIKGADAKK